MQLSFLKFVTVTTVISSCLASNLPFHVKEVGEKDIAGIEPLKTAGGAIASIGLHIAACIGQLRPLECLAEVIQRAWEHEDDPSVSALLARPALLSEPKEEHSGHRLNPFWTPPATITIAEWLTKFTKRSESFYDLFSISNMFTSSPSIPFSELSFELLAIIDVVGVNARMDSSFTKYIGISHAVLFSAKFPWSKGLRPKKHRIQLDQVDSIVTYLGNDWEYPEREVLLDKKIGHDLKKIHPEAWSNLMRDIQEMKYHIKGGKRLLDGEKVQLISEVQPWSTVKEMINLYPFDFWKNTLDYWLYEKVIAIPNLFEHIKNQRNPKSEIPQEMEGLIENVEITKSESNGVETNLAFFAKRLYSSQLEIEEFKKFIDLVYNSKCSFNLETCETGNILMYNSLFYALPDQTKQRWVWEFLERAHLLKDKSEKFKEDNEEKEDAIIVNAHSINRVEVYRRVAKAFRRNPDPNLISFLALIDKGLIEVISNYQFIDSPLLNMEWIFDVKNSMNLRLVPEESSEESSGSSTEENQCSSIKVKVHARLRKAKKEKKLKVNQRGNATSLPSENKIDEDDFDELSEDTLKGISLTDKRPKPDVDHYEVSILRKGLIHEASNKVRQCVSSQDRYEEDITENDLPLQSGDVIFIRDMRSSQIRQPLKEIARLCFRENQRRNGELLDYVLSATNTIAIRVCDF